jgi:hypothetical protein
VDYFALLDSTQQIRGFSCVRSRNSEPPVDTIDSNVYIVSMDRSRTTRTNLFIDAELWRALRMRALQEGVSATDLLNRIIAAYLGQKAPAAHPPKKQTAQKRRA